MLHHQVTSKFCPTPKNALGGPGMLTVTTKMPDLIGLALLKEEVFRWLTPVPGVELVLGVEHGHKIFVWVMSHFLRYLKNLEVGFTCCHLHPLPPGVSLVSTSCPLHSLLTCIAPVCPFILPLPFIRRHDYHQPTAYIYINVSGGVKILAMSQVVPRCGLLPSKRGGVRRNSLRCPARSLANWVLRS